MSQMSHEELQDFLNFLCDKDVIDRPPSFDCEHEIIAVHSDDLKAQILAEGAEAEKNGEKRRPWSTRRCPLPLFLFG